MGSQGRPKAVPAPPAPLRIGVDGRTLVVQRTGIGRYVHEAGKALIATQVGVLDEYFSDGRDALLIAPKSPSALASAITRLAREPGMRRTLGRHARAAIEANHQWPELAKRTLEIYQRVLP